jgi:gamma-glutamylcyclotransferase (GGCT)/AIG2-like uncharacterized protein YtfP
MTSGRNVVHGELYTASVDVVMELDAFEECPERYVRNEIVLSDGRRAFAYVMSEQAVRGAELISNGVWAG